MRILKFIFLMLPVYLFAANPFWILESGQTRSTLHEKIEKTHEYLIESIPHCSCCSAFKEKAKAIHNQIDYCILQYEITHEKKYKQKLQELLDELQQLEDQFIESAKEELDKITYRKIRADLHAQHYDLIQEYNRFKCKRKLTRYFFDWSTEYVKSQLNANNVHKDEVALVKYTPSCCEAEKEFKEQRKHYVQAAMKKFFGDDFPNQIPTIGFVGTGGGYRAMILTTGYLKAFEDLGLLDAFTYITSLSGSTWFLVPWIMNRCTINGYQDLLRKKIKDNCFDIKGLSTLVSSDPLALISDIIWPKFIFGQSISSVDLYGGLLSMVLLSDFNENRHRQHLSDQISYIKEATKPFPIYTSVSMTKFDDGDYKYTWYEFNPAEVRNLDFDITIPAWAFDSEFDKGRSLEIAPESSLGYLMGIFGSAYTVNFTDINRLMYDECEHVPSWWNPIERIKYKVTKRLIALMEHLPTIGKKRFSPARIYNPFRNIWEGELGKVIPDWLAEQDEIILVDAGIDYNIPVRPLLRPCREVDIIIIGDSSGNVQTGQELIKFFTDAHEEFGYEYSRIDDGSNKTIGFYKDLEHKEAPKIIYINFLNDLELMQKGLEDHRLRHLIDEYKLHEFDAVECIENHFCSTFNFDYSIEEFSQLAGVAEFNVKANIDKIREFMRAEL